MGGIGAAMYSAVLNQEEHELKGTDKVPKIPGKLQQKK